MHAESFRTNLETILVLTQAFCNDHGTQNIHGVDGLVVKDQNGGNDA